VRSLPSCAAGRKLPVCAKQVGTRHPSGEPSYVLLCGLAVFGVFWGV
jgi:hypothetical protein